MERALDEGRGRKVVEPLLERLLGMAPEGDPAQVFAHRHLAELRLERDPWRAALHLRKVIAAHPNDDVSHSLMALAQALLGNYRSAVAGYRRALAITPNNPWYHHNLGHLLDVALDEPRAALPHLQMALDHADPPEHEITASAAHCLARCGRLDDALALAEEAAMAAPESKDHATLLDWIQRGAPPDEPSLPVGSGRRGGPSEAPKPSFERVERGCRTADAIVEVLLERHMRDDGFSAEIRERARAMWADYRDEREPRVKKPEICAAAVHYAIALISGAGVTQASVAQRYGVAAKSVSTRYGDIRQTLALTPGDPRYGA
ncbi:MAG: tetratricopeptide repeat protein [Myxococcota bacterium]|nr:tetratricopeptide repeat protein [Myxococcota bacterium]